jgi:flavin-dependent dehydrogenase
VTRSDGSDNFTLGDGARVAVIGGGPAGSFFSYFCLDMARRIGTDIRLDLYEPRDFSNAAPHGCNMCGGVVSESLVQALATEGIDIPPSVVQRGIDSYVLHTDVGDVRIDTPLQEKRIAAMHRGLGPRTVKESKWSSFDGHLQQLAVGKGATLIRDMIKDVSWENGRPRLTAKRGVSEDYDLVVVAVGVNTAILKRFHQLDSNYTPPRTVKTAIFEYYLGEEEVEKIVGSSMHVFLLNIPRLEFAAIIPKGEYVTVCMLGTDIDNELIESFLARDEVRSCLPPEIVAGKSSCRCSPRINVEGAAQPFADRIMFIGDCGVTRLYKDGIGAAYRTGKAAATTAVLQGVSAENFRKYFSPVCESIRRDNSYGKFTFAFTRVIQKWRFSRRAILSIIEGEQKKPHGAQRMSRAMWDVFTGSAPYKEILMRTLHPVFLFRLMWSFARSLLPFQKQSQRKVSIDER